jgi:hypothetical protein
METRAAIIDRIRQRAQQGRVRSGVKGSAATSLLLDRVGDSLAEPAETTQARRDVLRMPLGALDGVNIAEELSHDREDER